MQWYNKALVHRTLREMEEIFKGNLVLEYHPYVIYSTL